MIAVPLRMAASAAACIALAATWPAGVRAATHEFVILNRGHHTLVEAHARNALERQLLGETGWGPNLLGKAELAPGVEMHFYAPKDRMYCDQDLKFVYQDGHVAQTRKSMNVCTANEIQLRY